MCLSNSLISLDTRIMKLWFYPKTFVCLVLRDRSSCHSLDWLWALRDFPTFLFCFFSKQGVVDTSLILDLSYCITDWHPTWGLLASFSVVLGLQTCDITCGRKSRFQSLCLHWAHQGLILELNGNSSGRCDHSSDSGKTEDSFWLKSNSPRLVCPSDLKNRVGDLTEYEALSQSVMVGTRLCLPSKLAWW